MYASQDAASPTTSNKAFLLLLTTKKVLNGAWQNRHLTACPSNPVSPGFWSLVTGLMLTSATADLRTCTVQGFKRLKTYQRPALAEERWLNAMQARAAAALPQQHNTGQHHHHLVLLITLAPNQHQEIQNSVSMSITVRRFTVGQLCHHSAQYFRAPLSQHCWHSTLTLGQPDQNECLCGCLNRLNPA
jgi:hypothetical protein